MDNEQIINSIKYLCKKHDITITKLEETLGLSQGLISRWSKSDPSLNKIIDIADYFNASLDEVIGRGNIINDKFIEKLILKTDSTEMKWNSYKTGDDTILIPKQYYETLEIRFTCQEDADDYSNKHKEKSYYADINGHYISIYGIYEYYNIKDPKDLKLFIQPDENATLIEQDYTKEQLAPLWLKVLFALNEEAPDEIRAEEFKNSFVFEDIKEKPSRAAHDDFKDINSLLENPSFLELMETFNTSEFKKLQQTFSNPEFQTAIKAANLIQNYFNKKGNSYFNQKED